MIYLRFLSLFMSCALLIAPLPLSAIAQEIVVNFSALEKDAIAENPYDDFLYLGKEVSNIARIVSQLSSLDQDKQSPLHELNNHIEDGFFLAEQNAVEQALEYAEKFLQKNYAELDAELAEEIAAELNELINQVIDGSLTRASTQVIYTNLEVKGKTTLNKHLRTKQGIHASGKL